MASGSLEEFLDTIEEDGTHECVIDKVSIAVSKKDQRAWCIFTYVVDNEDSDLDGEEFREMFQDFSHFSVEDFKELSGKEKTDAKRNIRRKKERLASLGVPEDSLNGFEDWESLAGKRVEVTIETSTSTKDDGSSRKFTNVKNVRLI